MTPLLVKHLIAQTVLISMTLQSITSIKFSLDSRKVSWSVSSKAGIFSEKEIPAIVPGDIYSDLRLGGYINDPYYHGAQSALRFISENNWTYSAKFHVPNTILTYDRLVLKLDGVDTVSNIYLNQKFIGITDNMFITYEFDIKNILKIENLLTIKITSPIYYSFNESQTYDHKIPPECPQDLNHSYICHRNFIRKSQASFPWHWGPALPTMGIWKPIYIDATNTPALTDIAVQHMILRDDIWFVRIRAWTNVKAFYIQKTYILQVSLNNLYSYQVNISDVWLDEIDFQFNISKRKVKSWWPSGYGERNFYNLSVCLSDKNNRNIVVNCIDKIIAFRQVELIQQPLPGGLSFYFRINGVMIFMKGANWQPVDNFHHNATTERIYDLLMSVKQANMNMLRVWGGGYYECDEFYYIADRLGIMIWQDFMFANSMYPINQQHSRRITREVDSQARRLMHHPSIIVWCANNEIEQAISENWYKTDSNYTLYALSYLLLFDAITNPLRVSAISVLSTPSNGFKTELDRGISKQPNSPLWGDVHHYNYTAGRWYSEDHPKARFLSEYGVMSWPSLATLKQISKSQDWMEFSEFALERNRRSKGQEELNAQIRYYFNPPNSTHDPVLNFTYYIYLTQIHQAMYVKQVTLFARRHQNTGSDTGGFCMGALYWKLNNIWPAPSWSSLEFNGDWKMLHYYMKQAFQPTVITLAVEDDYLYAYIIVEHNKTVKADPNAFTLECRDFDSLIPVGKKKYRIGPWTPLISEKFLLDKYKTIITELNCTNSDNYLKLTWGDHYDYRFIYGFKNYRASPSKLEISIGEPVHKDEYYIYPISLQTSKPEIFVWLTTSQGARNFTVNGFVMDIAYKQIQYTSKKLYLKPTDLEKDIRLLTLSDLYTHHNMTC